MAPRAVELSNPPGRGKLTALEAKLKAEVEYEVIANAKMPEYVSDFDRAVQETKRLEAARADEDRPRARDAARCNDPEQGTKQGP